MVLPTHRLLTRWPEGADARVPLPARSTALDALLAALAAAPEDAPALGLLLPGRRAPADRGGPAGDVAPAERLDVAVIEREILLPHLGADQAALAHDGVLTLRQGRGRGRARWWRPARPPRPSSCGRIPKAAVAAVAEAGETMPQKSTYFFPKLLTGVAFHSLVDA